MKKQLLAIAMFALAGVSMVAQAAEKDVLAKAAVAAPVQKNVFQMESTSTVNGVRNNQIKRIPVTDRVRIFEMDGHCYIETSVLGLKEDGFDISSLSILGDKCDFGKPYGTN